MNTSIVFIIATHPDDGVLGMGGTLLRHQKAGDTFRGASVGLKRAEAFIEARRIIS